MIAVETVKKLTTTLSDETIEFIQEVLEEEVSRRKAKKILIEYQKHIEAMLNACTEIER